MTTPRARTVIDQTDRVIVWSRPHRLGRWVRIGSVGRAAAALFLADCDRRSGQQWLALPPGTTPGDGGRIRTAR